MWGRSRWGIRSFCTHEGSGNSGTYEVLAELMPGANLKGDGFSCFAVTKNKRDFELFLWMRKEYRKHKGCNFLRFMVLVL